MRQDIFEVGEEGMAVNELAQTLAINASEVVKILFMKGLMVTVNQARRSLTLPHRSHTTTLPAPHASSCQGTLVRLQRNPAPTRRLAAIAPAHQPPQGWSLYVKENLFEPACHHAHSGRCSHVHIPNHSMHRLCDQAWYTASP